MRIERSDDGKSNLTIDKENGICQVVVKKETYIPLEAYKALVKIAYSFLPQAVLPDYASTLEFITTSNLDQAFAHACNINKIVFPLGVGTDSPFLLICKKQDPKMNIPTYCILFFWQSHFYQFSVPFHEADIEQFAGKPLNDIQLPPFLFIKPDRPVRSLQTILKMGTKEMCYGLPKESGTGIDVISQYLGG